MSTLTFPRIYFRGEMSWDPAVSNNPAGLFDPVNVGIADPLPPGVTLDTLKQFIIDNDGGGWNYFGTHNSAFLTDRTKVTGGAIALGNAAAATDPLIRRPLDLRGKLVDLDAATVISTQLFSDRLVIGSPGARIVATKPFRLHARWINFNRNLGGLPIAGNASVVWQTTYPKDSVTFDDAAQSPLLAAIAAAAGQTDCAGIMLRFSTYRTLYFQNGIRNNIAERPRDQDELRTLYQQGKIFSNPAYSVVTGAVGIWRQGEFRSEPNGRRLFAAAVIPSAAPGLAAVPFGAAIVHVDEIQARLSVDFGATIPERNEALDKATYGDLELRVRAADGTVTAVAPITQAQYGKEAYEASAGILDIDLSAHADPNIMTKIATGDLLIATSSAVALRESPLIAVCDARDVYVEEGVPSEVTVAVRERGRLPSAAVNVAVFPYGRNQAALPANPSLTPVVLQPGASGNATLPIVPTAPGLVNFGLFPFPAANPAPIQPPGLNVNAHTYVSVRVMPFDNVLEASTPDSALTFSFLFREILQVYDIIYPRMSTFIDFTDRNAVEANANGIKSLIQDSLFEGNRYMPVTRDMSAGKRRLLARWCDLALAGAVPPDPVVPPDAPTTPTAMSSMPRRSDGK